MAASNALAADRLADTQLDRVTAGALLDFGCGGCSGRGAISTSSSSNLDGIGTSTGDTQIIGGTGSGGGAGSGTGTGGGGSGGGTGGGGSGTGTGGGGSGGGTGGGGSGSGTGGGGSGSGTGNGSIGGAGSNGALAAILPPQVPANVAAIISAIKPIP
ncbi:MAG: hypothetical protein AB7H71_00895 [Alphaproteobacteria bacterium]